MVKKEIKKDVMPVKLKVLIGVGIVVLLFILYIGLVKQPLSVTEVRSVSEPYTTTECLDKQLNSKYDWGESSFNVCYEYDTVCNSYDEYCCENNWYGGCNRYCSRCSGYSYPCLRYGSSCSFMFTNNDESGGTFGFTNAFIDYNGEELKVEQKTVYVYSNDKGSVVFKYFSDKKEVNTCYNLGVQIPSKTVCNDVVRTHYVDKDFSVIKYYTILQQWTGQVRWRYKL